APVPRRTPRGRTRPSRSSEVRWALTALGVRPTASARPSTAWGPRRNSVTSCPRVVCRNRSSPVLSFISSSGYPNLRRDGCLSNISNKVLTYCDEAGMVEHTHYRSVFMFRKSLVAAAVAGAAAFAFIAGAAPAAAQLDDATIVAIFDAANTADIETGELAMRRGQSDEVRNFGTMLARDHKAVRQMGRDLAKKLNVTPTPPADSSSAVAHAKAMATLRSVPDADFDQAFLAHEVDFHQAVLDA